MSRPDEIAIGLRGLKCWRRALELRNSTANRRMPIPKVPYVLTATARRAIGDAVEITTLEELEQMEKQLKCHNDISAAVIQALLVMQRTFGQRKPKQAEPNLFHLKTLQEYGEHFLLTGNVIQNTQMHHRRAINIALLIMEQFSRPDSPRCLQVFIETYLLFSDILMVLERTSSHSPISKQHNRWRHSVMKKMHLLVITLLKTFDLDRDEDDRLNLVLENFFRIEKLRSGFSSILHLANGADPKIVDENGKTSLHILAENCTPHSKESFFNVFQALLDAGCHLDQATPDGETLKCSCAQIIRRENIKIDEQEHQLPLSVHQFIEQHCASGCFQSHERFPNLTLK